MADEGDDGEGVHGEDHADITDGDVDDEQFWWLHMSTVHSGSHQH